MKVKDLIKELQKQDPEAECYVWQKSFLGEESGQNRIYRSKVDEVHKSEHNVLKIFLDGE